MATIFLETCKNNKLLELETNQKYVEIPELLQAELLSVLRSTQEENKSLNEENKSLNDCLSTLEEEMKEIRKMRELFATQQSQVPPMTMPVSIEGSLFFLLTKFRRLKFQVKIQV